MDIIKWSNIHIIGGQKGKQAILRHKHFFEEIMARYLLNLMKNMMYRSRKPIRLPER